MLKPEAGKATETGACDPVGAGAGARGAAEANVEEDAAKVEVNAEILNGAETNNLGRGAATVAQDVAAAPMMGEEGVEVGAAASAEGAVGVVEADGIEAEVAPRATIRLEKKHPLAIRWMHWINFPVLFTMIWSGLLIYWNDSIPPYQHAHEVYRAGLGRLTLFRFFPAWFYTNRFWDVRYHVTEGLGYHFFFMWIFAVNGLAYVTYLAWSGEWRVLAPTMRSWKEALLVTLHDLDLWKGELPVRKFNSAQKIAYTGVILMGAGSLLTGLAIYKPTEAHWLTTMLGGYEMARWEHFWLALGFCGFFVVHVSQVALAGWNNFRGMVSGWEIRPAETKPYAEERRDA